MTVQEAPPASPVRVVTHGAGSTLVEQIVDHYSGRIDDRLMRPGLKMPSIRRFASEQNVSRFTVVEAYDRLIARGYLEARPGSGFYVKPRDVQVHLAQARAWADAPASRIDVVWLIRNMFRQLPAHDMPGSGVMPQDWLDADLVTSNLRALGRQNGAPLLGYGQAQGYLPLRQQLQLKLAQHDIAASPESIVTTNGATQALDLVAQHFLRPGDTILVEDPGWFLMFGRFALLGARVVGVPRLADGPDLAALESLAATFRPRLFVMSSILHNPTGTSTTAARAHGLLQLAEKYDFRIVEDDVYADLAPSGGVAGTRVATLDQLRRVVYIGGFSKTLAANLRVGFIACDEALARDLTDLKMLVGLTSPELGERLVYRILSEGGYRRHLERLRTRIAHARERSTAILERLGCRRFDGHADGMFLWADTGVDTMALAQTLLDAGYLTAPGSLFSPSQQSGSWMRFNVAAMDNPVLVGRLGDALATMRASGRIPHPSTDATRPTSGSNTPT